MSSQVVTAVHGLVLNRSEIESASVQEVLRQAQDELRGLLQQRADLMRRIGTVKQTITGLANLFGDEILSEELLQMVDRKPPGRAPGFTQACRTVLMEAQRPLTVREVCAWMQDRMPTVLERHKDPLASLTTVLNRLGSTEKPRGHSMSAAAARGCGARSTRLRFPRK